MSTTGDPFADFNGISDFSEVVSGSINTLAAVLKNRVVSFVNGGDTYGLD